MTLSTAAADVFDPNKPSQAQLRNYVSSLQQQLLDIGFKSSGSATKWKVADNNIVEAFEWAASITIVLLGSVDNKTRIGNLLKITFETDQDGTAKIQISRKQGRERFLHIVSEGEDSNLMSSAWSNRNEAEREIAQWILENADSKIVLNLNPYDHPQPNLRAAAQALAPFVA
jgi:hypothetical protein